MIGDLVRKVDQVDDCRIKRGSGRSMRTFGGMIKENFAINDYKSRNRLVLMSKDIKFS